MKKACSLRIYGRVFNVGFRRYVHRYAIETEILGYVENDIDDGCVHIEAEGEPEKLDRFILLCQSGTPYSMITNVKIETKTYQNLFSDFKQIR